MGKWDWVKLKNSEREYIDSISDFIDKQNAVKKEMYKGNWTHQYSNSDLEKSIMKTVESYRHMKLIEAQVKKNKIKRFFKRIIKNYLVWAIYKIKDDLWEEKGNLQRYSKDELKSSDEALQHDLIRTCKLYKKAYT